MSDLFSQQSSFPLSKNQLEEMVKKQIEDIKKLKDEIKLLKHKNNDMGSYIYKQSTFNMMSKHVADAKKEKLLAKSLLYEIYDSLSTEPSISISDLLRYKRKIEDVFPEVRNKNLIQNDNDLL